MKTTRRSFLQTGATACLSLPAGVAPATAAAGGGAEAPGAKPVRYDLTWSRRDHTRLASRGVPRPQSLYFVNPGTTTPVLNPEGAMSLFPQDRVRAARERLKGVDAKAYLQHIIDHILVGKHTDHERVTAICMFVGDAICYSPVNCAYCPTDDGKKWRAIFETLELLELHDGRCGQGVRVTMDLLKLVGIESRTVVCVHHTSCEARYDGGWHLCDALMFGALQPQRDGIVPSADEIKREPYFVDAFVMPYLYCTPEEYLTADGFRALGGVFGEWGAGMPYQSYYWGAPCDSPPTLPYALVTQRLEGQRVRINWAPSFKPGAATIEYQVSIFADRDCTQLVHSATTGANSIDWLVPEMNRIYYTETIARDDHRRHNPRTWYLATRNNFMLVPKHDYGWFGVI